MELNENEISNNENTNTNDNNNDTTENKSDLSSKSVFVSGIPYTTTEDDLKAIFEKCGKIKSMKVPKYQDTGRNLGYAHIIFQKNKEAQKVFLINKTLNINKFELFTQNFFCFQNNNSKNFNFNQPSPSSKNKLIKLF